MQDERYAIYNHVIVVMVTAYMYLSGKDKFGFGFGGTGKKSTGNQFDDYGRVGGACMGKMRIIVLLYPVCSHVICHVIERQINFFFLFIQSL